jgi:hypothetical protein
LGPFKELRAKFAFDPVVLVDEGELVYAEFGGRDRQGGVFGGFREALQAFPYIDAN